MSQASITIGSLTVERLIGSAVAQAVPAVSALRCRVFRAWPYLYDGDEAYERAYLSDYAASPEAVLVVAKAEDEIVGAATAAPLGAHTNSFAALFESHGIAPDEVFYLGESVLDARYRGRGIGHAFFDLREDGGRTIATARGRPFAVFAFCGVIRPADHPLNPGNARSLEPFWRARGYTPKAGMIAPLAWRDVDQSTATNKQMQFWLRPFG
ncbi:MAG: GNAT family N-acetyltransferase [Hyphomicrobiaceae bacterium]